MLHRLFVWCVVALAVFQPAPAVAQTGFVNMVDHIHLGVPDQALGAEWYHTHFGGDSTSEGPDRLIFGKTRMIFQKTPAPLPSEGSVLDLIGFSVADLDATMKNLQADGVNVVKPAATVEGMKVAQVADPWGTLIEVVQDPTALGFHHVYVLSPDPVASLAWFADKFGGKPARYKGNVEGINNIQSEYEQKFGPGDYTPNIPVTYWSFRLMIGLGVLAALVALVALWFTRGGRTPRNRWLWLSAVVAIGLPLAANSFGWIFTEMGRQPWTVFGVFKTAESVSPSVSTADAATSLIVLTVLYGILAVVEVGLFVKYAQAGAPEIPPDSDDESPDRPLAFAY